MPHGITFIRGDGIGQEIIPKVIDIVNATGLKIVWERAYMGEEGVKIFNDPLPQRTLDLIKKNRVAIKGPTDTPGGKEAKRRSANVALRKELDLYANIRPVRSLIGVESNFKNIDLVVIRENLEDLYAGIEFMINSDLAIAISPITGTESARLIKRAFEYAVAHNRKKITLAHKSNILQQTHGLWVEAGEQVSKAYLVIKIETAIVDNLGQKLVMHPDWFDVLVFTNMNGDIFSDICAGMAGGLGIAAGVNLGDDCAVFEAVHGTAPDIAGKNLANPTALILSAVMMLEHIGEAQAALTIQQALLATLREGIYVTGDINHINPVSTTRMADAIIEKIKNS